KNPGITMTSRNSDPIGKMINTFDRGGDASAKGTYAESGTYASGSRGIPTAGAFAEAGVGHAKAEFSVFEAEAKGPNASAGVQASPLNASAVARAEVGSASASAGPLEVKAGLGVDTGASVGVDGVEVKLLGTGFKMGPNPSLSVLGTEVSCTVM
uniref:Si:ch73-106k19.5 n=1 Tax=Lepisosteus oculatus TaxID=7918 RepID=W5NNV6_LEPOC